MVRASEAAVALALASMLVAGCWDRREPEQVAHVLILAFDIDDRGFYEVAAQSADPSVMGGAGPDGAGGGAGAPARRPFWTNWAKGRTPFEAVANLVPTETRLLSLAHVEALLVSERLARRGIGPVIDTVERYRELRLSIHPAAVDGDLKKLLEAEFPLARSPAMGISRGLRVIRAERAIDPDRPFYEVLADLSRPGQDVFIPRIEVLPTEGPPGAGGEPGRAVQASPRPPAKIAGGAAFRGNRMVGWVSGADTRGWFWVTGKGERGVVLVKSPKGEALVALEVFHAESSLKPVVEDGKLGVEVRVSVGGRVREIASASGVEPPIDLRDPEVMLSLRRRFAEAIRNQIELTVSRSKELNSDILGLGNAIYRKRPDVWKTIADRWDEVFRDLPVRVIVESRISRPGMTWSPTVSR